MWERVKVRFLLAAHALVAQWTEQAASIGKVEGSTPSESTSFVKYVIGRYSICMLGKAIAIAAKAHEGQIDKAGKAYILHTLRVMMKMDTEEAMIIAVLHDTVEDTNVTIESLRQEGFSENILTAVDALTRKQPEPYTDFIERIKMNPLAIEVKIADLEDNSDLSRIDNPTEQDHKRNEKYMAALASLRAT